MMWSLPDQIRSFWKDETATATLELVIVFPLLILLFVAAFETALIVTRQVIMERSLDMSVRVLRLAQGVITDADTVRDTICSNTQLLPNCQELLTLDLQVVDRTTYDLPSNDQICAGRGNDIVIAPANVFDAGASDEFLLIRTCLIVDQILPFSAFGLNLASDDDGGLYMIATTIFVNEPR